MTSKDVNPSHQIRLPGVVGMVSAGIWLIALVVEYRYGFLELPEDSSLLLLYYIDEIMFLLALTGYLIMLLGLWKAKAAGGGIFGRISLGIFVGGLGTLLIAQVVNLLTGTKVFLYPVGGILQLFGGLLTGIAVLTAKRWHGWQKFAPLLQGLFYLFLFFLLAVFDQEPTQLTESIWQVTWFITSLALFTTASNATQAES